MLVAFLIVDDPDALEYLVGVLVGLGIGYATSSHQATLLVSHLDEVPHHLAVVGKSPLVE